MFDRWEVNVALLCLIITLVLGTPPAWDLVATSAFKSSCFPSPTKCIVCACIDICICWVASTNQSMYSWFKLRTHSLLFLWRLFFPPIIYVQLGGAATCFLCFLSKMFCNTFLVIGHFYIYKQRCISQINKCNDKPLLKAQSSLVFLPTWCCRKIWGRCSVGLNVDHLVALGENELWFSRGNLVPPAPPQNELHSNRAFSQFYFF